MDKYLQALIIAYIKLKGDLLIDDLSPLEQNAFMLIVDEYASPIKRLRFISNEMTTLDMVTYLCELLFDSEKEEKHD